MRSWTLDRLKIFRPNTSDDNDSCLSSGTYPDSSNSLTSVSSLSNLVTGIYSRLTAGGSEEYGNNNSAISENNNAGEGSMRPCHSLNVHRNACSTNDNNVEKKLEEGDNVFDSISESFLKSCTTADQRADELSLNHLVPDDLINKYCERLQTANRERRDGIIEGMLAMQFITLEPESIHSHITGKQRVFQVILDHDRSHYVLLEYQARERCIRVYDPLIPPEFNYETLLKLFPDNIKRQIIALFGHLFTSEEVTVLIVQGIEEQTDGWSCGLRAIAHLTLRVCNKSVEDFDLELSKVLDFFSTILDKCNPTFDEFYSANLGRKRPKAREQSFFRFLLNKNSMKITVTV